MRLAGACSRQDAARRIAGHLEQELAGHPRLVMKCMYRSHWRAFSPSAQVGMVDRPQAGCSSQALASMSLTSNWNPGSRAVRVFDLDLIDHVDAAPSENDLHESGVDPHAHDWSTPPRPEELAGLSRGSLAPASVLPGAVRVTVAPDVRVG